MIPWVRFHKFDLLASAKLFFSHFRKAYNNHRIFS